MDLKLMMLYYLFRYYAQTKFQSNLIGSRFLCVDLTWNDPYSLTWPDPIPHRGKGSGTWPQSSLSPRNLIIHVNPVMTSAMAIAKDLRPFCSRDFDFTMFCSCLKTLLAQHALLTLQVRALFKLKF